MKLALDTNAYSDMARGNVHISSLVASASHIVIPFIVLAELHAGFAVGSETNVNKEKLNAFLAKPGVQILYADPETLVHYVAIYKHLRAAGKMIPTNDLWIAALVIQHGAKFSSMDAHFDHVPGLERP